MTIPQLELELLAAGLLLHRGKTPAPQVLPTQGDIEQLGLAGTQTIGPKGAAYALRAKFGKGVVFTSGHRTIAAQVSAMADNIVKSRNRRWIFATYAKVNGQLGSPVAAAMQGWVTANPQATTKAALQAGLTGIAQKFTSAQLGTLSEHLETPSRAFDVQPSTSTTIPAAMTAIAKAGGGKFLAKEGGLVRWHLQLPAAAQIPTI